MEETCNIDGCTKGVHVKKHGWCTKHYNRWYRTGDPLGAAYDRVDGTPEQRWLVKANVGKRFECWIWSGALDKNGYGQFDITTGGVHKNHRAHLWGFEHFVRLLEPGEELDHLCRVHACVNYEEHLDPVTHVENVARGEAGIRNAEKTHCPRGHPYDEANTHITKRGGRECRECNRIKIRAYMRDKRGTAPDAVHNRDKTHCKHGHEFTPENTYRTKAGRVCKKCRAVSMLAYWERQVRE